MAAKSTESAKQITYLAGALKAPRITEAASRMADQARDAGWSFEDYLAAVLEREVSARNSSGAELRIKAAGFPSRKTLEDFDWDAQPATRQQIAALAAQASVDRRDLVAKVHERVAEVLDLADRRAEARDEERHAPRAIGERFD